MIYAPAPSLSDGVHPLNMNFEKPSVNEIVKGQIYLGNGELTFASLPAARSLETLKRIGTTHVLSVCPDYPSTGPNHLTIAVDDSEYDNILIHLPTACDFIEAALKDNGKVLVHCVMGISRSATVVAAYREDSSTAAYVHLKVVSRSHEDAEDKQGDQWYTPITVSSSSLKLLLNADTILVPLTRPTAVGSDSKSEIEFPEDVCQAESLILDAGITHVLSISPTKIPSAALTCLQKHQHIDLTDQKDALLLALPNACRFIKEAIESGGQVLVHSLVETTACIVVCAFSSFPSVLSTTSSSPLFLVMFANGLSGREALAKVHKELFKECHYCPTLQNPLVSEGHSGMSPTPMPKSGFPTDLRGIAAEIMSETGFDMSAFGKALVAIQRRVEVE
ncbi:hypothetical protein C0993_007489 [Termitomyces sp. T159_Od127]|nr:hypothetical protein C0993_007489 [Termitomyces sp. T159_Od127]